MLSSLIPTPQWRASKLKSAYRARVQVGVRLLNLLLKERSELPVSIRRELRAALILWQTP